MKLAAYAFATALILLGAAVTWSIVRGEDTRRDLEVVERRVTVDPCLRPESVSCQRRIALVLREIARRHPGVLRELGLRPRNERNEGNELNGNLTITPPRARGGGAAGPQGNGPVGRVRPPKRESNPPRNGPTPPAPAAPRPPVDLDVPLPLDVCVGDLVRINCN